MQRSFLLLVVVLGSSAACDMPKFQPPRSSAAASLSAEVEMAQTAPRMQGLTEVDLQIDEIDAELRRRPDDLQLQKSKAILLAYRANGLLRKGNRQYGYETYVEAGELWRKLAAAGIELGEQDRGLYSTALYNLACAQAIKKEVEPALAALREAVDGGFLRLDLLQTDVDLDNLRSLPEFNEIVEGVATLRRTNAQQRLSAEAIFPFDFQLPNVEGEILSLKDYEGKVLIVDIWATWCGPCQREIPHFVSLHQKFKDRGLEIVGINYEQETDPDELNQLMRRAIRDKRIPYQCIVGDEATRQQIPAFGGFPTTLFLDRQGRVRAKLVGYHEYDELEALVEGLLEDAADSDSIAARE
jgi:thiol-disulfide isomerase/thioredoxin